MDRVTMHMNDREPSRYVNPCRKTTEAGEGRVKRVEISQDHYGLEIYEDQAGDTWVRVKAGTFVSLPIPFPDFIVANQ